MKRVVRPTPVLLATLVLVGVMRLPGAAEPAVPVSLRTADGMQIAGTFYEPSRRPAPAVILLHMQTRSSADWRPLAERLAEAGIAALAIDLRGHGASGSVLIAPDATSGDWNRDLFDVQAARSMLTQWEGSDGAKIGIAGASIGANLAALHAAGDPTIRSLALLSAGLDYRGLRIEAAMRKYGERPAFLVASLEDPYATRSARQMTTFGTGVRELRLLSGAGHGTVMLSRQPDLIDLLVDWFERTLL
jgi:alpha-beta hydrolase superfamily lysophospholipase